MHITRLRRVFLTHASILAIAAGAAVVPAAANNYDDLTDSYMAGDFHNHTTCTDGTVSIETMVTASIKTYDLEWLASADHGGQSLRDCRYDDPEFDSSKTGSGYLWEQTIGAAALQGDVSKSTSYSYDGNSHQAMWRWQTIRDFVYPEIARLSKKLRNPMLYVGLETNVPGHEHTSTTVLGQQKPWIWNGTNPGNASALAEYEYRFDRSDTDMTGPGTWAGKVATASGTGSGTTNHLAKAVPSVAWMQANYPLESYYVPAHVERAGAFNANSNCGFNVEHFRDFNNAGPTVAVGFETMPGHQATNFRGEYKALFSTTCGDSAGVTTYGGVGLYGSKIGGLWDAMLGEGRNWFFYASSDWHHRGSFSPYVRESTQDFYPGEYQKLYIPRVEDESHMRPQHVVNSVRRGNSFSVSGDLISGDLKFTAEIVDDHRDRRQEWLHDFWDHDRWRDGNDAVVARMGDTLVVPRGKSVRVTMTVTLPKGPNNSPYSFNNPSLLQLGIKQPLNKPVLDHVDFITGKITGVIAPTDANYTNATNPSTHVYATFNANNWQTRGQMRTMTFVLHDVTSNMYVRARGTNLPAGTPNETDANGNPLSDLPTSIIPCTDAACPAHMQTDTKGNKLSSFDVAGWSDLWFYANPIFIRVADQPKLLVETNRALAQKLARSRD